MADNVHLGPRSREMSKSCVVSEQTLGSEGAVVRPSGCASPRSCCRTCVREVAPGPKRGECPSGWGTFCPSRRSCIRVAAVRADHGIFLCSWGAKPWAVLKHLRRKGMNVQAAVSIRGDAPGPRSPCAFEPRKGSMVQGVHMAMTEPIAKGPIGCIWDQGVHPWSDRITEIVILAQPNRGYSTACL